MGDDGPVQVSYPKQFSASHSLWHQTLNAAGIESNDRHLSGNNTGCWTSVVSVDLRTCTRSYAAAAYYQPISSRPNLVVLTEAEVREIVLTRERSAHSPTWKAEGVRYSYRGVDFTAYASREVILSAGSIQSPQVLELSGIGNKDILSAAGIQVKIDNANVGENLQDHLSRCLSPLLSSI